MTARPSSFLGAHAHRLIAKSNFLMLLDEWQPLEALRVAEKSDVLGPEYREAAVMAMVVMIKEELDCARELLGDPETCRECRENLMERVAFLYEQIGEVVQRHNVSPAAIQSYVGMTHVMFGSNRARVLHAQPSPAN